MKQSSEKLVLEALSVVQSGEKLSHRVEYELQHLPSSPMSDNMRKSLWDLFYAMMDGNDRKYYYPVIIPICMKLMYPLLTVCYQIANSKNQRYSQDEDLYQLICLKLLEEWLPNFNHAQGEFSSYIINRFKRVAMEMNKDEISEYMEQKYKHGRTVSYDEYIETRIDSEHESDTALFIGEKANAYSGASAEDIYIAKEARNDLQNKLNLTNISCNIENNMVQTITERDAMDFVILEKLFGGRNSAMLSHCLERVSQKKREEMEYDAG